MPVIPAVAAGVGAIGTIYAANKGAKAAEKAGQLEYQAAQEANALNEKIYNQTRADNEPFRQFGVSAGGALAGAFGLSAPSMTGSGTAPATSAPQPDWAGYGAANPDVMAWAQSGHGDPNKPIDQQSIEERLAYHYTNGGNAEGRSLPMTQPAQAAAPGAAPTGYSDPTATGGYTTPSRTPMAALDVSTAAFKESPGYQFSLAQGNKALGNIASANRGLMSGQRMKAASAYNVGMADQEFGNWRDYTTSQYNNDRNYGEAIYQSDRSRLDDRYDTRNNALLSMAGFGASANNANQNAAQSFAANSNNATMAGAQAKGNAGVNAANAWSQGLGNIMSTGAYLTGQYSGMGKANSGFNWARNQG